MSSKSEVQSRRLLNQTISTLLSGALLFGVATSVDAGPRDQAKRIHDRLTGVPASTAVLDAMEAKVAAGDAKGAALDAMKNPAFYNTTLKNFVTPWTNVALNPLADLNDYTATVIGMIRDDVPFNQVLSADIIYTGADGIVANAYSQTDNTHYQQLEAGRIDLSDPAKLVKRTQSGLADTQLTPETTAGVITTRGFAEAYLSGGTNRRAWRFIGMTFLCRDMEQLNDVSRPANRVRQDVSRSPGGDSSLFLNNCVGCHAGMDGLTGALAYYNWDDQATRLVFDSTQVQPKFLINANQFPAGYVTVNDSWINYWRSGPNAVLGWNSNLPNTGNGAKSMGMEVTASHAFAQCQAQKVYQKVCLHAPGNPADRTMVETFANNFEQSNYNMKNLFADTAAYCKGP